MIHRPVFSTFCLLLLLTFFVGHAAAEVVRAPGVDLSGRPVADVRVQGLKQVPEQLVRNAIRARKGAAYQPEVVEADIIRITHLGRFSSVQADVQPNDDGSVVLTYILVEQRLASDVQIVGNKAIDDQTLLGLVLLRAGDPIDPFLIDRAIKVIKEEYERQGYFVTDVSIDEDLLDEANILLFRVREGPKVRLRGIRFEGNTLFSDKELKSRISSRTYIFLIRSGALSRDVIDDDTARLRDFYRNRGYLDAQVGRRIELSPDQRDAVVVFLIEEGRQFIVNDIRVEGNEIFSAQQILEAMDLKVGDIYSVDRVRRSRELLIRMYGKLGFVQVQVEIDRLFHETEARVDLVIHVSSGRAYTVGRVLVRGNQNTKDNVVLRQVRGMRPGRRFDGEGIETTERRLRESTLFREANVTLLGSIDETVRDVLVEVKEQNTGSISFGAGISSDAGILGAIDLKQRNFDITDFPESFGEFVTGKAFRGAGQFFAITLQPGNERSLYSVQFREPYVFESRYFLDTRAFYFTRNRDDYDEERLGVNISVGQRFGDVWEGSIQMRAEHIDISGISTTAATDVFAVAGSSVITSLGVGLTRSTVDSRLFPSKGSLWEIGLSRTGAFGGDYNFTKISTEFRKFWTVDEDFFGRKTVVSMRVETGWIIDEDEAPIFERFYAGGHRSFRGFEFRGVGPRGVTMGGMKTSESVGGDFLFLLGFEYNFPIYQEVVRAVVFTDTGTVQDDIGLDEYRISVGAGIRLKIPFLGQAPFALDVAIPILKQSDDQDQLFSFDLAVPF